MSDSTPTTIEGLRAEVPRLTREVEEAKASLEQAGLFMSQDSFFRRRSVEEIKRLRADLALRAESVASLQREVDAARAERDEARRQHKAAMGAAVERAAERDKAREQAATEATCLGRAVEEIARLRAAVEAGRALYEAMRDRHYGRMPDEVQRAYDACGAALSSVTGGGGTCASCVNLRGLVERAASHIRNETHPRRNASMAPRRALLADLDAARAPPSPAAPLVREDHAECPSCGVAYVDAVTPCAVCHPVPPPAAPVGVEDDDKCPECKGRGGYCPPFVCAPDTPCRKCDGTGRVPRAPTSAEPAFAPCDCATCVEMRHAAPTPPPSPAAPVGVEPSRDDWSAGVIDAARRAVPVVRAALADVTCEGHARAGGCTHDDPCRACHADSKVDVLAAALDVLDAAPTPPPSTTAREVPIGATVETPGTGRRFVVDRYGPGPVGERKLYGATEDPDAEPDWVVERFAHVVAPPSTTPVVGDGLDVPDWLADGDDVLAGNGNLVIGEVGDLRALLAEVTRLRAVVPLAMAYRRARREAREQDDIDAAWDVLATALDSLTSTDGGGE